MPERLQVVGSSSDDKSARSCYSAYGHIERVANAVTQGARSQMAQFLDQAGSWIILAHGRCYGTQAVAELRRAFRWVL